MKCFEINYAHHQFATAKLLNVIQEVKVEISQILIFFRFIKNHIKKEIYRQVLDHKKVHPSLFAGGKSQHTYHYTRDINFIQNMKGIKAVETTYKKLYHLYVFKL